MKNSIQFNDKKLDYYVSFIGWKHFRFRYMDWWFFMFKKSTHVDSFQMRVCGIHIQAIEKGTSIKLLNIAKNKVKKKNLWIYNSW